MKEGIYDGNFLMLTGFESIEDIEKLESQWPGSGYHVPMKTYIEYRLFMEGNYKWSSIFKLITRKLGMVLYV